MLEFSLIIPSISENNFIILTKYHVILLSIVVFCNLATDHDASDSPLMELEVLHDHSIQAKVVCTGAGIGGGIVVAVLVVMIALVLVCWRRSRKIQRR
jgi:hypothetical protein